MMIDLYWKKYYGDVENWSSIERFDAQTAIPVAMVAGFDLGCVAVAFIFVSLRLYLRIQRKIANNEDVLVVLAWVFFAIAMSLEVTGTYYRQNSKAQFMAFLPTDGPPSKEALSMTTEQIWDRVNHYQHMKTIAQRVNWVMKLFYHVPLYFVKLAWILFYYTLVPRSFTTMRWILHFTLFFTFAGFVTTFVMVASACNLDRLFYGICYCSPFLIPEVVLTTFIFHAVSEILVYTLPLIIIFRLRTISIQKKLSVAVLFILGFFCLFLMIYNVLLASSLLPHVRISSNVIMVALFWPLEPAWALIIISLPAVKSLIDQGYKGVRSQISKLASSRADSSRNTASVGEIVTDSDYSTVKSIEEAKKIIIQNRLVDLEKGNQ